MEKHLQLLGILHIVYHSIGIVAAVAMIMLFGSLACVVPDPFASSILGGIGTFVALFILCLSVPGLIGGIALLKRAPWSRILLLIVGVLNIIDIPLGTALGVYTLWVLLNDESNTLLKRGAEPAPPATAQAAA